jgi:hypothetical protein
MLPEVPTSPMVQIARSLGFSEHKAKRFKAMNTIFLISTAITLIAIYLCWNSPNSVILIFLLTLCSFSALGSFILATWLLKAFLLLMGIVWLQWLCITSHCPKSLKLDRPEG